MGLRDWEISDWAERRRMREEYKKQRASILEEIERIRTSGRPNATTYSRFCLGTVEDTANTLGSVDTASVPELRRAVADMLRVSEDISRDFGDFLYGRTGRVGHDIREDVARNWSDFRGFDRKKAEVKEDLEKYERLHREAWIQQRDGSIQDIRYYLRERDILSTRRAELNAQINPPPGTRAAPISPSERRRIEGDLLNIDRSIVNIDKQLEKLGMNTTNLPAADDDAIRAHLDTNVWTQGRFTSKHLEKRRDLQKQYGIKDTERFGGTYGGLLTGVTSWLGFADETGGGIIINLVAFIATLYIVIYNIISPLVETFSFFMPFLNILKYPLYIMGVIIFYQFIKAIFYPFKEDIDAIGHHRKKKLDDVVVKIPSGDRP